MQISQMMSSAGQFKLSNDLLEFAGFHLEMVQTKDDCCELLELVTFFL